jgi:hypothetical protein
MPVDHVGEDAELYALGTLDDFERIRVARHARECGDCARRIADAEATVLRLIELGEQPPHALRPLVLPDRAPAPARGNGRWIAAVAAAFLIGLLPWGIARVQQRGASGGDALAAAAMLAGHFSHAPFVALAARAPKAKAIYPLEGGWLYIIAAPGSAALNVAVTPPGERRTIATLPPSAETRTVFVRYPGRIDSVALLDGATPIAIARL